MAAGTQAYIVDQDYDPRTITLEEWLSMFEKESTEIGGRQNKTWGNLIRNNKITKKYLNQPVITLIGAVPSESQSILADIQNAAGKQASTVQSKFRVIEANIVQFKPPYVAQEVSLENHSATHGLAFNSNIRVANDKRLAFQDWEIYVDGGKLEFYKGGEKKMSLE